MGVFIVVEDGSGYHVIVDTRSDTRAAYARDRSRAEAIVARLNDEAQEPATETIRLPDGRVRAGAGVSDWSARR